MLNWIVWNRTVLSSNCELKKNILILNWIVWIRTVWLNWIAWNRKVFGNLTVYLYKTEWFKIELIICIKMDLALNNRQRLICHKIQTNKHRGQLVFHTALRRSVPQWRSRFMGSREAERWQHTHTIYIYIYIYIYSEREIYSPTPVGSSSLAKK